MCTCEDPCMGRRSTPSVGRLTVLHVVDVVRLQDAYNYNFQYEFVNGNGNRTRLNIAIPNMAVEEGSGCTCTTDVVQFLVFDDPHACKFELSTAGDVEWLLFSYT